MKNRFLIIILLALAVGFISVDAKATMTIATFADPSKNSANPLFKVDFVHSMLTGGWSDAKTGLTLEIPYSGNNFADAWFSMTNVTITNISGTSGDTGSGEINFYANNTSTNPLLAIDFTSGSVSRFGWGADGIFVANNVTITGSEITDILSEQSFSFSFANLAKMPGYGSFNNGFTSTAAFNSSATVSIHRTPEPATLCLLGLGALSMIRRKKQENQV
jgi:hypothetical protein